MSGPSLTLLRQRLGEGVPPGRGDEDSVRRQWWAALATLQEDFLLPLQPLRGVWLASPLPALYEPELLRQLRGWVWAPAEIGALLQSPPPLLPGAAPRQAARSGPEGSPGFERLPLRADDGTDPFLLVITRNLQLALALDGPAQERRLLIRFDPPTLSAALRLLDERLDQAPGEAAGTLRETLRELGPLRSDEALALRFWPRLAERLAAMAPSVTLQPLVEGDGGPETNGELALLEALTHEVRTPLATIRTLIRSLLRRDDLPVLVRQRLEQIDSECSEQIDRFGLIFHAAELQRKPRGQQNLARTDLAQLLLQLEDLWQRQLGRRGLALRLEIAAPLPPVLSDPNRLETMLGGLIDRFIRGLPPGGTVVIGLQPAGQRLKLQLSCADQPAADRSREPAGDPPEHPRSAGVGPVLSWNPLTGSLQLSRQATQRLFHSLGGRMTERAGSGLTVFFPVAGAAAARDG